MEKFWIYLSVYLIGLVCGVILGIVIDRDAVYKGVFRIKQKGKDNTQQPNLTLKMEDKRATRRQRRAERKANKSLEILEK